MPDFLQSVLTQVGSAMTPLRALRTPAQAVEFFRQLGYEVPPGAIGAALANVSANADDLANAVHTLGEATSDGAIVLAVVDVFRRLVSSVNAIDQLHAQIKAGGGGALPNIDDFPRRLADFLVLDLLDHRQPDIHSTLHLVGLIEHEASPAPGQSSRLINWNRFAQIFQRPAQIANDVYRWETDFDVDTFVARLEVLMRAAALPGGLYPQSNTTRTVLGNKTSGLRELRFPILQRGVTPETYSQFGITFSPVEANGGQKKGFALLPYIIGAAAFQFDVCDRGQLTFQSSADIKGAGVVVRPPFNAQGILNATGDFNASIKVAEKPDKALEHIVIGSAGGSRLSMQGLGVSW